jgi:uncharacterized protein (DUF433 family)
MLGNGMNVDEILLQHPILEKDDIYAMLVYAALKIKGVFGS